MKKVVSNDELREKMTSAIDLLCDTVKTTLGPKGSNIIIDHSAFNPFITNDGVTIAENIESDDEVINTILTLAKESSIKTNELVGDGTTTTLVLLQSIYHEGIKLINNGINPIIIKNELSNYLKIVEGKIKKESWQVGKEELKKIATIAGGSAEIGKIICDAYLKVKDKDKIKIKEGNYNTEVIYKKGYVIESMISPYYFQNKKCIELDNPYILIFNSFLTDIEDISNIINFVVDNKKSLVIWAEDFSDKFSNDLVSLNLQNNLDIYLLKIPGYGIEKINVINDLCLISKSELNNINVENLGVINNIKIKENECLISFDKELITNKRIKNLSKGLIEINVGALTTTERRELKMRYDDAKEAIFSSQNGVLLGGGVTLYKISEELKEDNNASKIYKNALKKPLEQIISNAGLNNNIISKIKENNYDIVYNILTNKYETKENTMVLDTLDIVLSCIKNATSIASMLLSTTSLVINEYQNNMNKINDYNEL